jgi:lethal(2) giant larvae protein
MFKFATNKFTNSGNNNNNNNNAGTNSPAHTNTQSTGTSVANRASGIISNVSHNANKLLHSHYHHSSSNQDDSLSKRRQIQKDLFGFNKIADKGFPSKPSAMDYDRKLKLLAIGTKNGDIRIYGQPNTRQQQLSSYQDVHPFPILKLIFVQGQHQLITLSERVQRNDLTNKGESQFYLVLWQIPNINDSNNIIEKVKEYQLDPKILSNTRLSAITLLNDNSHLFMGFETGDVYVFNVSSFQLVPGVINKDYILKNIPEPAANSNTKTQNLKKLNQLGAVESICHHPRQLTKLLIAYQRGLWIIFDFIKNQIDQINQTQQQLESAIFYQYGECVATSHSDGSFILWDLLQSETASSTITTSPNTPSTCTSSSAPNIVYGPYPCKPVTKCLVKTYKNDQPLVIFRYLSKNLLNFIEMYIKK